MAATGARPKASDFTGREREKLQKEHAEELALRAQEMSMASAAAAEEAANSITDLTQKAPVVIDAVEEVELNLSSATVVIRVNDDIEDMTLGVGNNYTFKAGQKYKVPKMVADHLEEKGYIWH